MNHFLSIPKEWESRDEKLYYEYLIEKKKSKRQERIKHILKLKNFQIMPEYKL